VEIDVIAPLSTSLTRAPPAHGALDWTCHDFKAEIMPRIVLPALEPAREAAKAASVSSEAGKASADDRPLADVNCLYRLMAWMRFFTVAGDEADCKAEDMRFWKFFVLAEEDRCTSLSPRSGEGCRRWQTILIG
jgi:hypothetical protein